MGGAERLGSVRRPPRAARERALYLPAMKQATKPYARDLAVNVDDVALVFEGGGMRASYTAGVVVTLLERNVSFGRVYGISAGSSHACNYVSRDAARAKASFVDLAADPDFGGLGTWLSGKGYFNAPHLYEGIAEDLAATDPEALMAFDFETFRANPADLHIEALDQDSGFTVAWTKADMPTMRDMMLRVRASSTMPGFMPSVSLGGSRYVDGGLGDGWGILLEAARADGFERFFIVRTQERAYRKRPPSAPARRFLKALFWRRPKVAERMIARWERYNALLDEIERLEREGAACVFCPERMTVTSRTRDLAALEDSYARGYAQAQREADAWERWLQRG